MHQPWRTFAAIINRCISRKTTDFMFQADNRDISPEQPAKKPKQAKKPAKKSTTVPTAGVAIRDTPGVSMSKKKAPAKVDRGKDMDLLSEAALLKAAQLKQALKKSKQDTHMLHASGPGDGVGSQPKGDSDDDSHNDNSDDVSNDDDDDDDSDADGDNEASDSEKTDSDENENPSLNLKDDKEEEYEEENVHTPKNYEFTDDEEEYDELYKDVNMRLKDPEHEEERKGDAEMTGVALDNVSQENSYEQDKDDAHVTLTAAHVTQKTKGPKQSSFVSFDFASKFLNLDNVPPADNEVASMMNVKVRHEESSTQAPSLLIVPVTVIPKTSTVAATTIPLTI
ncbi:hypothetical protein Tco_0995493, partial [Tanacetum coccineum]